MFSGDLLLSNSSTNPILEAPERGRARGPDARLLELNEAAV